MAAYMSDRSLAVSAWATRLRSMTGRLDGLFLPLESVFLGTGSRLRELHGSVSRLSASIEGAGALFSSAKMAEIMDKLADTARHIDTMRQQRGGLSTTLSQMTAATEAMAGRLRNSGAHGSFGHMEELPGLVTQWAAEGTA